MPEQENNYRRPKSWLERFAKAIVDFFTSNRFTHPMDHSERMNKRRRKTRFDRW